MIELLKIIPTPITIAIACLLLGAAGIVAADSRYVQIGAFQKSYELSLAKEIRELRRELSNEQNERARELLQREIEALLDDLCHEKPDHIYCESRA